MMGYPKFLNPAFLKLVRELVDSLPKCDHCDAPATRAFKRGAERYCDKHSLGGCPDYPRAEPLRKILDVLENGGK